jgi:8-oxo-dGTP pyrophosphatase MutT (NUDIX family)
LRSLRELQEETGYTPDDIRLIGRHAPNPAVQNNWQNTYIAYNCRRTGEIQPDAYEDLRVVVMAIPEVLAAIKDGRINHTIEIASLFYALPILGIKP